MFLSRVIRWYTVRNFEIRWKEHEEPQKDSEPAKHLKNNPAHSFNWKDLPASSNRRIRQTWKHLGSNNSTLANIT